MSKYPPAPAPISAAHMDRIEQDAKRGIGASSADTLRLVGELSRFLRDPLTIESNWVNAMFNIVEDQNATYDALLAENDRLRELVAAQQSRPLDTRLAGFWRSPKDMPPEDTQVVVLRDAGHVGNGEHPGHRTGRWLELTTASRLLFICDALSTGNVIGWVGADEFLGLEGLSANACRYVWLRSKDEATAAHFLGYSDGSVGDSIIDKAMSRESGEEFRCKTCSCEWTGTKSHPFTDCKAPDVRAGWRP